jgi:hypothetical protein
MRNIAGRVTGAVATIENGIAEPPRVNEAEHAVKLTLAVLERLITTPASRYLFELTEQREHISRNR